MTGVKTKKNILVVDDDACMRELLRVHLANAGYDVTSAEDAVVAGKRLLNERRPDLLIVDVQMPYMNGIELVNAIRAESGMEALPVILISSRDSFESAALLLGAQYLVKPFTKDDLLRTVVACLHASANRQEAGLRLDFPALGPSLAAATGGA